jgi:hypothetical protein
MMGLDHRAVRLMADERSALLRGEMERSRRGPARRRRQRLGLWVVGVGFRLAGECAPPPQSVPTA